MNHLNLLAVGNSFSANALRYLNPLVEADGTCSLTLGHAMIGGCPLDKHVRLARLHEENPADPEGLPYWHQGRKASLQDLLRAGRWDVVTIQQYSGWSFKIETYRPHARELCELIRRLAPQAEIVFHETWAYRSDDAIYRDDFTPEQMHRGLAAAYREIAAEVGIARLLPVGDAFAAVSRLPDWRFARDPAFDYEHPRFPALPDQRHSLHAGYGWRKNAEQADCFCLDAHHAGVLGEFLGGCVWFERLFGRDARRNPFVPPGVAEEDARALRCAAHEAVEAVTG